MEDTSKRMQNHAPDLDQKTEPANICRASAEAYTPITVIADDKMCQPLYQE